MWLFVIAGLKCPPPFCSFKTGGAGFVGVVPTRICPLFQTIRTIFLSVLLTNIAEPEQTGRSIILRAWVKSESCDVFLSKGKSLLQTLVIYLI